ncbi:MAG: MG2 domain-containing protein [Terracidiphilus sp.]
MSAIFRHGSLEVKIPYHAPVNADGKLVTEILDPENDVLGRVERAVEVRAGDGTWQETIAPVKPLAFEDMVWQRIRYRFAFDDGKISAIEGVDSIGEVLRRPVVHVLGQKEYITGSRAAIRVMVSDVNSHVPQTGMLRVELVGAGGKARALYAGTLNRRGTAEADFRVPQGLAGKYVLNFLVDTPVGTAEEKEPVEIKDKASILLTTEKPVYQPGQTIHVRALALEQANHRADAARKLTFEVEDSRGNKVFRKATETDRFGIASAEFVLADEVNLGAYHVRALMGNFESPVNTAEIAVQVERYVLPKFKVAIEFDKKDGKQKRDYRPGDHVTGTVRANYFFGKPVDRAVVAIKASSMDVEVVEAASASGKTDGDGAYRFDLKLPEYFAGKPLSGGAARALIEATVKDAAEHAETRGEPITVSAEPLLITAVPEGGTLAPQMENEVFILTAYPDGSPARTTLNVHRPDGHEERLSTDDAGVAVLRLNPGAGIESLRVEADDHKGHRVASTVPLEMREGTDQVLLRTERAVFKTGERIGLKVFSTRSSGTAYVDVVKNGQTVLTRDVDLRNGQAELTLTATPEMTGTVDLDAYVFGRAAEAVADHRLLFVQPADELKIEATPDAAVYRPGDEARIKFHVTNARGEGVQAALGLQVVDEAVFALAEKQPGFAKVFFYLEQELMKTRYEIHSLSMESAVNPIEPVENEAQDLGARALFAATEMAMPAKLDVEFGKDLPAEKFGEYQERYHAAFVEQVRGIAESLSRKLREHPEEMVKAFEGLKDSAVTRDAWNTPMRMEPVGWSRGRNRFFLVRSAGADRQFGNQDDLTVYLEERTGRVVGEPGRGGRMDVRTEHAYGPWNGRAEFDGTIVDMSGAVVPGANVTVKLMPGGEMRAARSDAAGRFTLAALPEGRYRIEIVSPGFEQLRSDVILHARDRALVAATLNVGAMTEAVTVEAAPMPAPLMNMNMAAMGAVGGGIERRWVAGKAAQAQFAAADNLALEAREEVQDLKKDKGAAGAGEAHVRSYFPEALYINPEIVTDGRGDASVVISMADSITTWRMAMLASTEAGALGTGSASLKVFQDFFVDLDLPVTLTQGDRVSVPVAIYNYTAGAGQVQLALKQEDWFALENDDAKKSVAVEAGRVGSAQFTIDAKKIGKFKLTLTAHMEGAGGRDDVVVREIEVVPNGLEQNVVFNGRLEKTAEHELKFPVEAIPDATSILVRLYPGPLSQVIEGMDSILSMPGGCFEQTSSSTYPNVLALDYMKRTKKLTPEVYAKAEGYIANGYQRLLTFEVPGGGFSWFGQAPANKILTAYGLMEFSDMAKVSDVDPRLIERTGTWLASQQQADGSWKPDTYFINEGATNRYNSDVLRITAYIAWALANTGTQEGAVGKAQRYIDAHMDAKPDAYTLAVIANFAMDSKGDREFTRRAMEALLDARTEKGDEISWSAEETGVYATGESAAIETTGLATQALLKWGQASETVRKAMTYLSARKQASGTWGTTQATIMALRALLFATELSASDVRGSVAVTLDGKEVETLKLTEENNDLLHQFVLKGIDAQKAHDVELKFDGRGGLAYQVAGRFFTPWGEGHERDHDHGALTIHVAYDRAQLAQNDVVTATATVRNIQPEFAKMVMVDLGIPPGFDLLSEDLQGFQEKTAGDASGRLEKFSQTATQAILYFNGLAPGQTVSLKFRLRAKYPIRAKTFESRVYEYYDPGVSATAQPVELEVRER